MTELKFQDLGQGIYCVDSGLYRHALAACYLIREGDRLAFVDTGTSHTVPGLLQLIRDLGLSPEQVDYVIPTHVHLDHAGGAGTLMAACPNATLVIHPKGAPHMIDPAKLTAGATAVYGEAAFERDFGTLQAVPEHRVVAGADGQTLDFNGRRVTLLHTPGHANHHFCIFDERSQGVFTGDTFGISYRELDAEPGMYLFAPTTPVAFDPDAWLQSIDKLLAKNPRGAYLTHYSRLPDPARHAETLRDSIRAMAELALAEENEDETGRLERLHHSVREHLAQGAVEHGCSLPRERIEQLLQVDSELNAQGLEVWLKRRARSRAS